jgi:ATP sulfurylase
VNTEQETVEDAVAKILGELERHNYLRRAPVDCTPAAEQRNELLQLVRKAPGVDISARDHADLYMLSTGAVAPLYGFMDQADYRAVVETGRLAGGAPFTLPILLRVEADVARAANSAEWLGLRRQGQLVGLLKLTGAFRTDVEAEAAAVYATRDEAHPGVRLLRSAPSWALAGEAVALARPPSAFPDYDLTPSEVRAAVAERGWRTMVGFQTRNPAYRAHEYLRKMTLESVDGLLLHPLVGEIKNDDIPADVRLRCYEALLANYRPADRPLLATNPVWIRYAGPKEAVFHALVRRTSAAPTSSSVGIMPVSAATTAPTLPIAFSISTNRASSASRSSTSATLSAAGLAAARPRPRPGQMSSTDGKLSSIDGKSTVGMRRTTCPRQGAVAD